VGDGRRFIPENYEKISQITIKVEGRDENTTVFYKKWEKAKKIDIEVKRDAT
jgi:hypothetical protein